MARLWQHGSPSSALPGGASLKLKRSPPPRFAVLVIQQKALLNDFGRFVCQQLYMMPLLSIELAPATSPWLLSSERAESVDMGVLSARASRFAKSMACHVSPAGSPPPHTPNQLPMCESRARLVIITPAICGQPVTRRLTPDVDPSHAPIVGSNR